MPAAQTGGPRRGVTTAEARRSDRLRKVGEVLQLYERLQQALGEAADADLERLAAASRAGERALGDWARNIEDFRLFKRGFENGTLSRSRLFANDRGAPRDEPWTLEEPQAIPFMWEAVAFILGFGLAVYLT